MADTNEEIKKELDEVKDFASNFSPGEVKDGTWFIKFLHWALSAYTREVNAEYFERKYPGLPADALVDLRINLAARYAGMGGGASALVFSALVAATIGSHGGASPMTIPAGAANVLTDTMWTSRLQLRLAWDLAVLYKRPINIDDPEDLYELFQVAFGVKAAETFKDSVAKLTPEAVRQGVKVVASGARLQWLQALPVIGKYLLQRNIIKLAIPIVNVPVSAGLNYYFTRQVGKAARAIYRDKVSIHELAKQMSETSLPPDILLETIYLVARADDSVVAEEAWLLRDAAKYLELDGFSEEVKRFQAIVDLSEVKLFAKLGSLPDESKAALFEAAQTAAAIDHKIHKKEIAFLKRLASVCGTTFDEKDLRARASGTK